MGVTVQTVIDLMVKQPIPNTVDGLLAGKPDDKVEAIAVAFMASQQVIEEAAALGASLLITHEGLHYAHRDPVEELKQDAVFLDKNERVRQSGIAIYRNHDSVHRAQPDLITAGLVEHLGWSGSVEEVRDYASIVTLSAAQPLVEIVQEVKQKLGIHYVRVIGDPNSLCQRIGLSAGYRGGASIMLPLNDPEPIDLFIIGEGMEWEVPAYVTDAVQQGRDKALIVLGHAESEVPGMKLLADQLRTALDGVPVYFISEKPLFQLM
ncbi:putative NIF3 family GTP cyclohydrolase 1 type 2 [Paenibacillus cellulosilyticus]|uniref:GTP cyclohydrolase 1 type 2 homolog n=1 Tax=Paenibacillus cellulosilyticus TaxID=375489 RepID=A0A2V2YRW2_9BACL|nr:Nif3-like dinuclear metal center hexameric protein [Paenibacillus cellulosilyticus]PWV99728.1 putative NIF3 family GTP cyclohydrolase 1 type 2 [Paenibacillus cellulosilyticus]QKS44842.1 Nif3-like dinuclear metal center hexameric protein [Paenibacillus cellulosilyticus]